VLVLVILIALSFVTSAEVSRGGATTQREVNNAVAPLRRCVRDLPQSTELPIEVFQILDLPLSVHEASLVKSEKTYLLKLLLGNSSDVKIIGFRYSLVTVDAYNKVKPLANVTEGFAVPAYGSKTATLKNPLRIKVKSGERVVLMLEQVISRESIWEVVKAKDALEAYARGDYSVTPVVMRVPNAVDAPDRPRVIFQKYRF
jgi:hypothetical protein